MRKYTQPGIALESNGNRLGIDFDGVCSVVITMQTPGCKRETLIYANWMRTKVSQKYVIEGTVLQEDVTRNSTGADNLTAPKADIYVTIVAEKLLQSLVVMQLNRRRYYLQWREVIEDGTPRHAVYLQSEQSFQHEQAFKNRPAIQNAHDWFLPPKTTWPSPTGEEIKAKRELQKGLENTAASENSDKSDAETESTICGEPNQKSAKLSEFGAVAGATDVDHTPDLQDDLAANETQQEQMVENADKNETSTNTATDLPENSAMVGESELKMETNGSDTDDSDMIIEYESIIIRGKSMAAEDSYETAESDEEKLVIAEPEMEAISNDKISAEDKAE